MKTLEEVVIEKIEKELRIFYQGEVPVGNVCFSSTNSEKQDAFKETFTENDLECFLGSFQKEELQIPTDPLQFWERVQSGKQKLEI